MSTLTAVPGTTEATRPAWGAVFAMTLCVFVLIASEFMPVSLLTPIARDLGVTEGQAGQAISISGLFAVATSLLVTRLIGALDRRVVLVALALLLAASGARGVRARLPRADGGARPPGHRHRRLLVAQHVHHLNTSIIMRLLPTALLPVGLAVSNGGVAFASTVSAPLGAYLGELIGWRWTFFAVVPLALAAATWQALALPQLPALASRRTGGVLRLLGDHRVAVGMGAILLFFMGQFALFTYLRPFLEQVTGVDVPTLSSLLLVVGVASLMGSALIGGVLRAGLSVALVGIPLLMAAVALALALLGTSTWAVAGLLALWGLVGAGGPVAWGVWLSRTLPGDAEAGSGLMVAVIQLAITLGATVGGLVFDAFGPVPDVALAAAILALAALAAFLAAHTLPRRP